MSPFDSVSLQVHPDGILEVRLGSNGDLREIEPSLPASLRNSVTNPADLWQYIPAMVGPQFTEQGRDSAMTVTLYSCAE